MLRFAIGVVLSVAVAGCFGGGVPVGQPSDAAYEELESAVMESVLVLLEAPAVEIVEETSVDGERGSALWVDLRPNLGGAFVALAGDANTTAFGKVLGATPVAQVDTREARYLAAGENATWSVEPGASLFIPPVVFPLEQMPPLTMEPVQTEREVRVTRQDTSDGGAIWALRGLGSVPFDSLIWTVHPDGHLRAYTVILRNVGEGGFEGRLETTYRPITDPDPLPEPEPGAGLDLELFDLPEGFLTGGK